MVQLTDILLQMTKISFQTEIIRALETAGEVLLKHFGKVTHIKVKENLSSVVSEADLESEKVILDILTKDFPDYNIISEECGYKYKGSEYTWIVDPLDGTSNFVAGLPWFGILIAVMKDHTPVAGGAYLPADQQLYYAEQDKKARLNGKLIQVSQSSELKNVLVAYSLDFCPFFKDTLAETSIIASLVRNARNVRSTNCLLDLCYTADGRLGAVINQKEKIWDIAAPWLIIKEAGGLVTDRDSNELNFSLSEKDYGKDYPMIAANPQIHSQIIRLIRETLA
jgi:myo-inositol-1(or 4)-monophosphatase